MPIPDGLVPRVLPALAPNDENDVERRQRLRREHADRLARGLTELQAEVALIRAVAQGDRAEAVLPPLPRAQRIALHAFAEGLGLWHESVGPADRRALRVRRWEDEEEVLQEVLQDAQEVLLLCRIFRDLQVLHAFAPLKAQSLKQLNNYLTFRREHQHLLESDENLLISSK